MGTPLKTPRPGRSSLAILPSSGGLIADSGTSRTDVKRNDIYAYIRQLYDPVSQHANIEALGCYVPYRTNLVLGSSS